MKILALIPARGGSKRLPGKNIKLLGGKPLIDWTIDVATRIPEICEVLVSTDDQDTALIAKKSGACVPWLRPKKLSTDDATSVDVAIHALDWYEKEISKVDGLVLLQPTSPFRTPETIVRGITLFCSGNVHSVIGVSPIKDHPMWAVKKSGNHLAPYLENNGIGKRSQELEEVFSINGGFYLTTPLNLRERKSFLSEFSIPLIIDSPRESLDIDSEFDFQIAEAFI